MKKIIVLLSILTVSIFSGFIFGALLDVKPVIPGIISFVAAFVPMPAGSFYMLLFTAPGGAGTPFQYNGPVLSEILHWNDAAAPITNLRVTTKEHGTLHDFNAAGIAAMNGFNHKGTQAANDVTVNIATGALDAQVTINGTTSAGGAINFYSSSDNRGQGMNPLPLMTQIDTNIALSQTTYQNFMALFIPTMATLTDYIDVEFNDGHKERWEIQDLIARSTLYQQVPGIILNNVTSYIHRATLRTLANTPVYTLKIFIKGQ
jgi:hypothetical protein